jgi:hypothetical protein
MKILRYLIFLSILSSIFFAIYRQSDQKGFRRWLISFKAAVLFAASAAGLIPLNTEAIESPGNNNQVYQERLLSDQKVILVKTGVVYLHFQLHLDEGSRVLSQNHLRNPILRLL